MANTLLAKDPADTCVLVTGGAGFIGSHTVVELLERGYQVVVVDDLSNSSREAVRRVGEIAGVAPVFANVRDMEAAEAAIAIADAVAVAQAGTSAREADSTAAAAAGTAATTPGPSLAFYEASILDRAALDVCGKVIPGNLACRNSTL